jgi:hypothetical protein
LRPAAHVAGHPDDSRCEARKATRSRRWMIKLGDASQFL